MKLSPLYPVTEETTVLESDPKSKFLNYLGGIAKVYAQRLKDNPEKAQKFLAGFAKSELVAVNAQGFAIEHLFDDSKNLIEKMATIEWAWEEARKQIEQNEQK